MREGHLRCVTLDTGCPGAPRLQRGWAWWYRAPGGIVAMRRCCRAGLWAAAARLEKLNKDSLREAVLPFVVVKGSDMRCNDRCGEAALADYLLQRAG